MKKMLLILLVVLTLTNILTAATYKKQRLNPIPVSKTKFEIYDANGNYVKAVDLTGKDFIVVSVREPGSDGQMYAVDRDGTIWWHGLISSGASGHETTSGIHRILLKRRFHMSSKYPDPSGVNNMDFELQFTQDGQALHLGNTAAMSHGCIHVGRQDISALFKWANVGMPVVLMRGNYKQFLKQEVDQFREDLREYNAATGSHK